MTTNTITHHTPGPWAVQYDPATARTYIVPKDTGAIAQVYCLHPEYEHNTHLIAAAPEMLEAIKVVSSLPGFESDEPHRIQVTAAITKAEGRQ